MDLSSQLYFPLLNSSDKYNKKNVMVNHRQLFGADIAFNTNPERSVASEQCRFNGSISFIRNVLAPFVIVSLDFI
jgi:hypothetical protein